MFVKVFVVAVVHKEITKQPMRYRLQLCNLNLSAEVKHNSIWIVQNHQVIKIELNSNKHVLSRLNGEKFL